MPPGTSITSISSRLIVTDQLVERRFRVVAEANTCGAGAAWPTVQIAEEYASHPQAQYHFVRRPLNCRLGGWQGLVWSRHNEHWNPVFSPLPVCLFRNLLK